MRTILTAHMIKSLLATLFLIGIFATGVSAIVDLADKRKDQDLYIMYSYMDQIYKIGRSNNPYRRRKEIDLYVDGEVVLLKIYPYKGYLEHEIHTIMEKRNVDTEYGREWFTLNHDDLCLIDAIILMHQ